MTVIIWPTVKEVKQAGWYTNKDDKIWGFHRYVMTCTYNASGERTFRKGSSLGEVHLALSKLGVGLVAHEFMHVITRWLQITGRDKKMTNIRGRHIEEVAEVAGEMNRQFWAWFYKAVDKKK